MRGTIYLTLPFLLAATVGCGTDVKGESTTAGAAAPPIAVSSASPPSSDPIQRFLEVTGTLAAQEEAEVAAEVQGRVVATPVERGTRVAEGDSPHPDCRGGDGSPGRRGRRERRADRRTARAR